MSGNVIAELMRRNLFEVFNEPDTERRRAVIGQIYTLIAEVSPPS